MTQKSDTLCESTREYANEKPISIGLRQHVQYYSDIYITDNQIKINVHESSMSSNKSVFWCALKGIHNGSQALLR